MSLRSTRSIRIQKIYCERLKWSTAGIYIGTQFYHGMGEKRPRETTRPSAAPTAATRDDLIRRTYQTVVRWNRARGARLDDLTMATRIVSVGANVAEWEGYLEAMEQEIRDWAATIAPAKPC